MEQQFVELNPLQSEWEKARERLPVGKYNDDVLRLLHHAFFLGSAMTIDALIHSGAPTLRLIVMRMELRNLFGKDTAA